LPIKVGQTMAQKAGLETTIAEAIRAKGFEVHLAIGCSGYRVDIGIVNPEKRSEYLLGILLDGDGYNAAHTARDREIVQTGALRALGWKLHRVWSTDWWEKKEVVILGIVKAIEAAKMLEVKPLPMSETPKELPKEIVTEAPRFEGVLNNAALPNLTLKKPEVSIIYEVCLLEKVKDASVDVFFFSQTRLLLQKQIAQVLELESPISKNLLYSRVLNAWGIGRAGGRIARHLDGLVVELNIRQSRQREQIFLWKETQHSNLYELFRIAGNEAEKRAAEDLPPEEIANGSRHILKQQLSLPKEDLVRECARLFGYARLGIKVEAAMHRGIEEALERGVIEARGSRMVYREGLK
ncbi:MAG: DUF3320 domain-containing protein, partial [Chitinophagaceae bacterium]